LVPPTISAIFNPDVELTMTEITTLLAAVRNGDNQAGEEAFGILYDDLRKLAHSRLSQHKTFTLLDTNSLVHDCYLKLVSGQSWPIENRRHFFAYASQVMRSVIVDFARARQAERRGGGAEVVPLDTNLSDQLSAPENDVLRINDALDALAKIDERAAQVVEMRYFGGLTEPDIAESLGVSERTVRRSWEKAKVLLTVELA
jgi:RNA polymerase sigma factor (TIGR02999 family)